MKRVASLILAIGATVTLSAQSSPSDFDPKHPPDAVCGAAALKLQEAGTSKVVLAMALDASGRVQAFKTESPKGLRLEKIKEAASAIKSMQFKPAIKDGSPVAVQIGVEFDCADSLAYRTIPPKLVHDVSPVYPESAMGGTGGRTVSVQLTIQTDGVPKDVRVAKGVREDIDDSALDAVRQWRVHPAMRDGKPIEVRVTVEVSFNP